MSKIKAALSNIPDTHRLPLLEEYNTIVSNYLEQRWSPSEMSGGRFSEIVFSILNGIATGTYAVKPFKPNNIVDECKKLESKTTLPRSFRILIPRMLPALYDIRNNRGAGHVGSEVDPNHMDATVVLSMVNWIMAELVRELHSLKITEAQSIVDKLVERQIPLVWENKDIKRVLNKKISAKDQILILLASSSIDLKIEDLLKWTEYKNKNDFKKILKKLHSDRLIEFNSTTEEVKLLPPGSKYVSELLTKYSKTE